MGRDDEQALALSQEFSARQEQLRFLCVRLGEITTDALALPHIDRVSFRAKETRSFLRKALSETGDQRRYHNPLREVEDQVAGRVLVFFRSDLEPVRQRLIETFGAVEDVRKEPESPAEFSYESDHLVLHIPPFLVPDSWERRQDVPVTFEMQVRTLFQHAWAEPQHDLGYKSEADLDRETKRQLAWVAASAWGADQVLDQVHRGGAN